MWWGHQGSWSVWVSILQINKLDFIGSSKDEHVLGNECVIIPPSLARRVQSAMAAFVAGLGGKERRPGHTKQGLLKTRKDVRARWQYVCLDALLLHLWGHNPS